MHRRGSLILLKRESGSRLGVEEFLSWNAQLGSLIATKQPVPATFNSQIFEVSKKFSTAANLAPLATSDDVLLIIRSSLDALGRLSQTPNADQVTETAKAFFDLRTKLQSAARSDLWPAGPRTDRH